MVSTPAPVTMLTCASVRSACTCSRNASRCAAGKASTARVKARACALSSARTSGSNERSAAKASARVQSPRTPAVDQPRAGDPVKPGGKLRARLVVIARADDAHPHFLQQLIGDRGNANRTQQETVHRAFVPRVEALEGCAIAARVTHHERLVGIRILLRGTRTASVRQVRVGPTGAQHRSVERFGGMAHPAIMQTR